MFYMTIRDLTGAAYGLYRETVNLSMPAVMVRSYIVCECVLRWCELRCVRLASMCTLGSVRCALVCVIRCIHLRTATRVQHTLASAALTTLV